MVKVNGRGIMKVNNRIKNNTTIRIGQRKDREEKREERE